MKILVNEGQRFRFFLNLIFLAFSLYAISNQDVAYEESSPFENFMIDSFAPMQKFVMGIRGKVDRNVEDYLLNVNASRENKVLQTRVLELKGKIYELDEIERENERLRELLNFGIEGEYQRIAARIVAWDSSSDYRVLRINKGKRHGVVLEAPVISGSGVVGHIFRLTENYADVLTIVDPNNRVDAIVDRTRSHGIILGLSSNRCLMKYVSRTDPIILHDKVFTSGLGNIYPKGLMIGEVTKIERESYGITQTIEVTPSVEFDRLEEVIILTGEGAQTLKREWKELNLKESEGF